MKLNNKVIEKIYRNNDWAIPPFDFRKDKADAVIPFIVKTGFINATEKGNTFSQDVTDYSRFERIFTGFEAVIVQWEGSTETEIVNNKLVKKFQSGKSIDMWIDNTQSIDEVNELQEDTDFLTERVVSTITAYTTKRMNELDIIKLYTFPARHGKVLYHIDNIVSYNNPENNNDSYYVITFKSVNDRLSNTGISINQYIQNAAPGEGYAYPKVITALSYRELHDIKLNEKIYASINDVPSGLPDNTYIYVDNYLNNKGISQVVTIGGQWTHISNEYGVVIDETLINSNPIKSMQIEIFGKGILSDIYFYGRPLKLTNDERGNEIKQPRQIVLNKPNQPDNTQRDITQPYARNTAYNWIKKSQIVVESWYDSWSAQRKGGVNPGSTKNWMGALEIFYGTAYEVVTVNPFVRAIGDIVTFGVAEFFWPTTTEFSKRQGEDGSVVELKSDANFNLDFSSMFNNNYYKNKSVPRLPVSYQETVMWSLKEIPLVGGFFNKVTLGLNRGWRQSTDLGGRHYNVSGVIPTALLDFYQNAYMPPKKKASTALGGNDAAYTAIPLDDLQSDSSPSSVSKVDYATIINYSLTDQFTDSNALGTIGQKFNTEDMNYEDQYGNPKVVWDANKSHAIDPENIDGFAIDLFGIHFVGDADIKITFFDTNKKSVWTSKLKTVSQLTESVRDWNTTYKLSNWDAPAGQSVDSKTPYQLKTSDYTIDVSDAAQSKLRNGFPTNDTSHPTFKTQGGEIVLADDGSPISEITSTGVKETTAVKDLVVGDVDNVVTTPYVKQQITQIQEFNLIVSPSRIIQIADREETTKSTSIIDILNTQKFDKNSVRQFSKLMIDLKLHTNKIVSGNAFNSEDTYNKDFEYPLTFNIIQTNDAQGYRLELAPNFKEIKDKLDASYAFFIAKGTTMEWSITDEGVITLNSNFSGNVYDFRNVYAGESYFELKEIIFAK